MLPGGGDLHSSADGCEKPTRARSLLALVETLTRASIIKKTGARLAHSGLRIFAYSVIRLFGYSVIRTFAHSREHLCWWTARQSNRKERNNGPDREGADEIENVQRRYKMSDDEQAGTNYANDESQNFQSSSRVRSSAAGVWSNALTLGEEGRPVKGLRMFLSRCSVLTSCSRPRRSQPFAYVEESFMPCDTNSPRPAPKNVFLGVGRAALTPATSGGRARTPDTRRRHRDTAG